ncbi:MAG: SurA N-terminal domain-containing protein [Deltaproteobacteria bacterium]|jgi:hypothetical protein|nr:SurA N-terminal domain-containing protein [Deltaproteobacteria bacterium]
MRPYLFLALLLCLPLQACEQENIHPGEVALVNGKPITLRQIQAMHDVQVIGGDSPGRAMEDLRKEYGSVLSEIIAQELVAQELERLNLSVTDGEVRQLEEEYKQDYPPGGFESMLLEESLDVEMWRETLRYRLAVFKFNTRVLRPQVSITAEEVDEYFRTHEDEFKVPERLSFIQFSSLIRDQVAAAAEQFRNTQDAEAIQARFQNMNIRMVVMRQDRLDPRLVAALEKLNPMESIQPVEINSEYVSIVLLGKENARLLSREEIYARIESILLEDKLQSAFESWLAGKITSSDIKVSVHLLPPDLR